MIRTGAIAGLAGVALAAQEPDVTGGTLKLAYSDCGDKTTHGKFTSLSPTTVNLGTKTPLKGKGAVDEDIQGASFEVQAKALGITVFKHSGDACKEELIKLPAGAGSIDMHGFKCPLAKGDVELDLDLSLAGSIPASLARLTIDLKAKTNTGDKALCAEIKTSPAAEEIGEVAKEVQDGPRDFSDYSFADFLKEHEKAYEPKELEKRQAIFHSNLAKVVAHNEEYKAGKHTWWATMNHLADFTDDEHRALRATSTYSASQHPVVELTATAPNPPAVDWREKGKVISPVKNQGGCGSCWAFSATETVESHYAIASGKLLTLAPQTYVNCVKNPHQCGGTGGCEGATMELAFNMTRDSGIALEADLPYQGRDEKCAAYKAAVKVTGYVKNPVNDAKALETAVATKGPQAITVAAEPWQLYGGGIFSGCNKPGLFRRKPNIDLDHGVQLVGYTADYWIVRNSWGSFWGEKGYIRISRANDDKLFTDSTPADGVACKPTPKSQTVGGECGILFDTSYPVGVKAAEEAVVV